MKKELSEITEDLREMVKDMHEQEIVHVWEVISEALLELIMKQRKEQE